MSFRILFELRLKPIGIKDLSWIMTGEMIEIVNLPQLMTRRKSCQQHLNPIPMLSARDQPQPAGFMLWSASLHRTTKESL